MNEICPWCETTLYVHDYTYALRLFRGEILHLRCLPPNRRYGAPYHSIMPYIAFVGLLCQ